MTDLMTAPRPSRRAILAGGAGLTLAFALAPETRAQQARLPPAG